MSGTAALLRPMQRLTALAKSSAEQLAIKGRGCLRNSAPSFATTTESATNKAKETASDMANKASATASKAGEAVGASQAGAADASRKAAGEASGVAQKAKETVAGAGQKMQGAAEDVKGAASEYASKAQGAVGDAATKARGAASSAGQQAGQHASAAAGGVAGTATAKAGGVPLWGLAAAGVAAGALVYYGFKKSPGSHGDKFTDHKVEDTPGAVAPATPTTIAAFTVTGADGKPVTLDDFKGDFALVVFGRGKDIDLSASKLMRLRDVITESDKRSNMHYTKAAYVSEDPDNDKPEALMKLLERVGAVGPKTEQRVMALTGPQVDKIKRSAHALTARAGKEGKPQPQPGTDSSLYLMDPECKFVVIYEDKSTIDEVADSVAKQILNYKRTNGAWHAVKAAKPRVA